MNMSVVMGKACSIRRFAYGTWYGAGVCFAVSLFVLTALTVLTGVMRNDSPYWLVCLSENVSLLTVALFLNEIIAIIVSLVRRRWAVAFVQFAVGSGLLILLLFISLLLLYVGLGEPSKDYFTRKHGIPRNVSCQEPKLGYFGGKHDYGLANCSDEFSQSLFRAASSTGAVEEAVSVSLSALDRLAGNRREFLLAYLAAHPGWWLHEDNGRLCATRRWKVDGRWFHPLHGYYSGEVSGEIFQTRTTLGFPDFVFGEPEHAHPLEGQVKIVPEEKPYGPPSGSLQLRGENVSVDVYDQDGSRRWKMMRAAVAFLKDEFERLEGISSEEGIRSLLPEDAVKRGKDSFVLRDGMQGGIYNLTLRLNPGEEGSVYVKAFEVTKGIPLSVRSIADSTNERIGWSKDPDEKFLSEVEFTVDEGDWDDYYAARFEVWFRPASGMPERKLMECVYKIQGWQR